MLSLKVAVSVVLVAMIGRRCSHCYDCSSVISSLGAVAGALVARRGRWWLSLEAVFGALFGSNPEMVNDLT